MKPTVGRIVHFYDEMGRGPFAAMVTGTYEEDDVVDLDVHSRPTSGRHRATITSRRAVELRKDDGLGWCWPPRVEDTRTNVERIVDVAKSHGLREMSTEERKKGFGRE